MAKIRILSEAIAGRIAAGEVVERPCSIVKELVENAIDAGATAVSIAIEEGGIKLIRVADNGSGIAPDDMPLTIVKHATSKIFSLSDLDHIGTMGFRGEALASIAAVSELTIRSKTPDNELGSELHATGGEVDYINEAGVANGTTTIVENLFFNTPARRKFLKRPASEAAAITDCVSRLILSYPNVSIRYTSGSTTIYHSPGSGDLNDAIISIYGVRIKPRLIPIDAKQGDMKLSGYISSPELNYKTFKHGSIFVNGRYIKSQDINHAILAGYTERLLKGTFPMFVLHLDLPLSSVDVNVHPNKLSIKFIDDNKVSQFITDTIYETLYTAVRTPKLDLEYKRDIKGPTIQAIKSTAEPTLKNKTIEIEAENNKIEAQRTVSRKDIDNILNRVPDYKAESTIMRQTSPYSVEAVLGKEQKSKTEMHDFKLPRSEEQEQNEQPSLINTIGSYNIIGTAFSTYIIVESDDTIYMIDQHAAHERLVYDMLLKESGGVIQPLLEGEPYDVTHDEMLLIEDNLELINKIGIELSRLGQFCYSINAVPMVLGDIEPSSIMKDILSVLTESRRQNIVLRQEKLAKAACKRAVKAGQKLSEDQLNSIMQQILINKTMPYCPHGRPIAVAFTRTDLEKSFRRRV